MDFGNKKIYKCPKCGKLIGSFSILSTSNYSATSYSDGHTSGIMHAEEEFIAKCPKCKTIYLLNEENKIGECSGQFSDNPKWNNAKAPEMLEKNDYIKALEQKIHKNKDEELYLRNIVWRELNRAELSKDEEKLYKLNCRKLLKLYDTKNLREKLLIAELHRNLGNFDESTEILESIRNKDYIWIRNILLYECQKKNKKTVRLEKGSIRQVKKGNKLVFEEPAQELFCENCGTSNFIFSNDKAPYKCSYCKYGLKR